MSFAVETPAALGAVALAAHYTARIVNHADPRVLPARRLPAERVLSRHAFAQRLRRRVRGAVLTDAASRGRYATDASIYQVDPVAVLIPEDFVDLEAALELANAMEVPVLPRGAGSSLCGQTVGEALVIDCTPHLNKVQRVDLTAGNAEVEPGVVLDQLNAGLRSQGWWFPVDIASSAQATLGGMAGNNASGSRSLAYGNMVHNTEGIEVMLADGTVEWFGPFGLRGGVPMRTARGAALVSRLFELGRAHHDEIAARFPQLLRRVGGYNLDVFHPQSPRPYTADGSVNLAHLLVGSEGTLGVFRRLRLRLARLPAQRVLGAVNFASLSAAMASTRHIVALQPVAVELVDRSIVAWARHDPIWRQAMECALAQPDQPAPEAILLVEFSGGERAALLRKLDELATCLEDHACGATLVRISAEEAQKAVWEVRKAGSDMVMRLRGDGKPVSFIEDCAVPLEHLAEYTAALNEVFARHGTRGCWHAHASVGTLHVRPVLDMRRDGAAKMRAIAEEAALLVRRFKGAFSGEHGDGLVRSEWVGWQFGERLDAAFQAIKDAFDPKGLMNPGKIVRATRMDQKELFRYMPGYAMLPLHTALDWSAWDVHNDPRTGVLSPPGTGGDPALGFGKAVEMCNNNGTCRKFDAGVMCPSFRVTRDEKHSVRGRANTLRLAASGQLGRAALQDPAVHQALAWCVGCKACRRECPAGVDMARMKIEVLAQRRAVSSPGLRERLLAALPFWAPYVSRVPGLMNLLGRQGPLRSLAQALGGLARLRSLPHWAARPYHRIAAQIAAPATPWREGRQPAPQGRRADAPRPLVVLWADTFNNYFEPEVLRDAQAVLSAAGCEVVPQHTLVAAKDPLCCGRTRLAFGDVQGARSALMRTLEVLGPWLDRGACLVGLEPSCLLTMRDELLVMRLDSRRSQQLSSSAWLFAEFLERGLADASLALDLAPLAGVSALVHGHCHQKAFDAFAPTMALLARIPGLHSTPLESGCCGMAGAFGYDAAHYPVSMAMAEESLLPALRGADPHTVVVAEGTSCRHQIADGTGRRAVHLASLVARSAGVHHEAGRR